MNNEREPIRGFFYTDDTPKSQEARELLKSTGVRVIERTEDAGIKFESGFNPPILQTPEGDFRGLKGIKMFVEIETNKVAHKAK